MTAQIFDGGRVESAAAFVVRIAQSAPETHAIEALLGELGFVMRDVATTRRDPESGVVLGTDLLFARAMVRH